MKSKQEDVPQTEETKKKKYKRRRHSTSQICRECIHLKRMIKEGVYHCDAKNRDYTFVTITQLRATPCEYYEVGKLDAVSAMPIGAEKITRYTEYRCIKCGSIMDDGYSFDECYCNNCKSENEVDRKKIKKYLDDNDVLSGLRVAVIERTVKDYVDTLKNIMKTYDNERLTAETKEQRMKTLLNEKNKLEKYLFSKDFMRLNIAELNPINVINCSQEKVGYDEYTYGA